MCGVWGGERGGEELLHSSNADRRNSSWEHLKQGQKNLNSVLVVVVVVVMRYWCVCGRVGGGGVGGRVAAQLNQQFKCHSPRLPLGQSTQGQENFSSLRHSGGWSLCVCLGERGAGRGVCGGKGGGGGRQLLLSSINSLNAARRDSRWEHLKQGQKNLHSVLVAVVVVVMWYSCVCVLEEWGG